MNGLRKGLRTGRKKREYKITKGRRHDKEKQRGKKNRKEEERNNKRKNENI
jgi:hypothetical protein